VDQLGRHAVNAKRLPGRLLVSLYPLHLAKWLRYFPCTQLMLVRSVGAWSAEALRPVARFLGVDEASALHAAAAAAVRPEQHWFNREAAGLGAGLSKQPMLGRTKKALQAFFEAHWDARFTEVRACSAGTRVTQAGAGFLFCNAPNPHACISLVCRK